MGLVTLLASEAPGGEDALPEADGVLRERRAQALVDAMHAHHLSRVGAADGEPQKAEPDPSVVEAFERLIVAVDGDPQYTPEKGHQALIRAIGAEAAEAAYRAFEPNAPEFVKAQAIVAFQFAAEQHASEVARERQRAVRAQKLATEGGFHATVRVTHVGDLTIAADIEVTGEVVDEIIIRRDRDRVNAFGIVHKVLEADPTLPEKLRVASEGDRFEVS